MSDSIIAMLVYTLPEFLKPFGRKCVISILDPDVVWSNGYIPEFSSSLREFLFELAHTRGFAQRWLMLPRFKGRQLSPTKPNGNGLYNFPEYTFPTTPYYVAPTVWNRWGPLALIHRSRGIAVPGDEYYGNGVRWESMGARLKDPERQRTAELRVRANARILMDKGWGYRAKVNFQPKPLVADEKWGVGYGDRENAYSDRD
jgi:hypothetical protein